MEKYVDFFSDGRRVKCTGKRGFQEDDIINTDSTTYKRYGSETCQILFRYYTLNKDLKNYHARIILLDGVNAGKEVSMRIA